jgi:hypothetical protein
MFNCRLLTLETFAKLKDIEKMFDKYITFMDKKKKDVNSSQIIKLRQFKYQTFYGNKKTENILEKSGGLPCRITRFAIKTLDISVNGQFEEIK